MTATVQIRDSARLKRLEDDFDRLRRVELEEHLGDWVLLATYGIVGYFDNEHAAVTAGYETVRGEPFLVKQMLEADPVITVSMVSLTTRL